MRFACLGLLALVVSTTAYAAPQRMAQVKNGVVVNVIVADPGFDPGDGSQLVPSATAGVGDAYASGVFTPAVPPPPPPHQTTGLTFIQFIGLFTPQEQAAVIGSNDVQIKIFIAMATGAGPLDLTNPEVVAGVNYLAATNVISPARAATILSGAPHG